MGISQEAFADKCGMHRTYISAIECYRRSISLGGTEWLRFKVIVFEKIRSDYYVMSVLEEDQLETLKQQSQVVATNGSAANSKKYGLL